MIVRTSRMATSNTTITSEISAVKLSAAQVPVGFAIGVTFAVVVDGGDVFCDFFTRFDRLQLGIVAVLPDLTPLAEAAEKQKISDLFVVDIDIDLI